MIDQDLGKIHEDAPRKITESHSLKISKQFL